MLRAALALVFTAVAAIAQNPAPSAAQGQPNGSISGAVKDEGTGAPIADVSVSVYTNTRFANGTIFMSSNSKEIRVVTDAQGHYRLSDLPASTYRVFARAGGGRGPGPHSEKMVNLRPGQELRSIDFAFPAYGSITGRVLDQNKEPVPGANVYLLSKEYSLTGGVGYFYKEAATADDQGEYKLPNVEPGYPFLLMAVKRTPAPPVSDAPVNLKLRKQSFVPTYYPNVAEPEGAAPMTLFAGEHREGIDVRLLRAPSFCIEGTMEGPGGPTAGRLLIAGQEFQGGIAAGGGLGMVPPSVNVGPDGKVRLCGLRRGSYRLMAAFTPPTNPNTPSQFGTAQATITEEDVTRLRVIAGPGLPIPGIVVWEGAPADPPLTARLTVNLQPINRLHFAGEPEAFLRAPIPGEFTFPNVFMDDYRIGANVNAPGVYVKDILYGTSVMHAALRVGSANELRVVLARDGGTVAVKVADKDGNPVPDIHVALMPAELHSEATLSDSLVAGETDQDGNYSHGVLAPGKYLVVATTMRLDRTFERVRKLWAMRSQAKTVELRPNGTAQITIEPSRPE